MRGHQTQSVACGTSWTPVSICNFHCALAAAVTLLLPPNMRGTRADYVYAVVETTSAWMAKLSAVYPKVVAVMFPTGGGLILSPELSECVFIVGADKHGGLEATQDVLRSWTRVWVQLLQKVPGPGQKWEFENSDEKMPCLSI